MAAMTEKCRQEAVGTLRARLERAEELSGVSDDGIALFLVQAKWSVDDAAALLQAHMKWRAENLPVLRDEVAQVFEAQRMAVLDSACPDGRPVMLLNFKELSQVDFSQKKELALHLRAAVHCAEEMVSRMPPGTSQWVAIINCAGIVIPPTAFLQALTQLFSTHYPERAHKVIVYPVPRMVVRFVQSFMWFVPSTQKDKNRFVDTPESLCKEADLDREQLPIELLR